MYFGRREGGEQLVHEGVVDRDDEDLAGPLDLRVLDEARDVGVGAGWAWIARQLRYPSTHAFMAPPFGNESIARRVEIREKESKSRAWKYIGNVDRDLLKAAGTPMIRPLPSANSVARLTLLPGLPSSSSTVGMESPGLTMIAVVVGLACWVFPFWFWEKVDEGARKGEEEGTEDEIIYL